LIIQLAEEFGNQSILVSIDAEKKWLGRFQRNAAALGKQMAMDWREDIVETVRGGAFHRPHQAVLIIYPKCEELKALFK